MKRFCVVRECSSEEMEKEKTNRFETILRTNKLEDAKKHYEDSKLKHPDWRLLLKSIELSGGNDLSVIVEDIADSAIEEKEKTMIEIVEDGLEKENIKTYELKDTIVLMESADYKDRFKAEYWQLRDRYKKLVSMLTKWDNGQLDFTPTCPRSLYTKQVNAMHEYLDVLERRAELESVDLNA